MIKYFLLFTLFILGTQTFAQEPPKPKVSPRYVIRPVTGEKTIKPEEAIKAFCNFAKIDDYIIDSELISESGKVGTITGRELEVLLQKIIKVFDIDVVKTTFEDDSVLYHFKKAKKK